MDIEYSERIQRMIKEEDEYKRTNLQFQFGLVFVWTDLDGAQRAFQTSFGLQLFLHRDEDIGAVWDSILIKYAEKQGEVTSVTYTDKRGLVHEDVVEVLSFMSTFDPNRHSRPSF